MFGAAAIALAKTKKVSLYTKAQVTHCGFQTGALAESALLIKSLRTLASPPTSAA